MDSIGKTLILIGIVLIAAGLLWHFTGGKIPLGRLPGDIRFESQNSKVFIPVTSSILISIFLSLILYFFRK